MSYRVLILLLSIMAFCNASEWMKNRSATGKYKKGKYAEAEKEFHAAQIEAPEQKEIAFNRGCALYKMGDYENAVKEFEKAKSIPDLLIKKKSAFNTANSLFKKGLSSKDESGQKSVEEAAKIYKEILKREPSDLPSRQNLEKALHVIEQMKKQQNEKDKNKDDKQDNKDKQDKQDKQDKNENKDGEQKENDKKKEEDKQENKEDDKKEDESKKQQPQPKAGEMSKEEAQKLLDALKEDEQDKQKKLMQLRSRGKKLEKDW